MIETARILSEAYLPSDGILVSDVTLVFSAIIDGSPVNRTVTLEANAGDAEAGNYDEVTILNLIMDALAGDGEHFSDLEVGHTGLNLEIDAEDPAYGFEISAEGSSNLDLIGLAGATNALPYYQPAILAGFEAMPGTGELARDAVLDLQVGDADEDPYLGQVTLLASETEGNVNISQLVEYLNTRLSENENFSGIQATLDEGSGIITLHSVGVEFALLGSSVDVRQLGYIGEDTWETVETRYPALLEVADAAPATGVLIEDVRLVVRIVDEELADILLGAVDIEAASTAENTGLADLVADINSALAAAAVPRYEALSFGDYLVAELREGEGGERMR